ncbi:MAG: hypothetical protein ACREKI_06345, partial [Gemmatimonadota bacterium]
ELVAYERDPALDLRVVALPPANAVQKQLFARIAGDEDSVVDSASLATGNRADAGLGGTAPVAFLAVLAAVAAGLVLRRRRRLRPPRAGWLTDRMVAEIIARGRLETDDGPELPLDWEEIRREEDRFWTESWDRPEPYTE